MNKIISTKTHTLIGLGGGVLLLLAPYLFNFTDNEAATISAMAIGVFIILSELITTSPYSLIKLVPMKAHIMLDVGTGLLLALSPWLFGFMDNNEISQWIPHVLVGIFVIGYALMTSTSDEQAKSIAR